MEGERRQYFKRVFFGGLILLLILAAATLPLLPRDNSIENMLPRDSGIHEMLHFLHEARFAGQVAISFERESSIPNSDFLEAIDRAVEKLKSPLIERVIYRLDLQTATADIGFFQKQLPALTGKEGLAAIQNRLSSDSVGRALRRNYLALIRPGGSIALPLMQRDPLHIERDFLSRLQSLAASSGYTIEIKDGYLFSSDGGHALAVLETSAPVTDISASRELLAVVDAALAALPAGVTADVVCGHRHSVSNEAVLKRDVQRAVLAASSGFLLLFALCFRDHRAQFIFAIPLASVLLSLHLCRWLTGPLSLFVLGFGVVIVGIAVDYGIHIYVALRGAEDPARAWRAVVRPVVLGALTTLGVFAAFFAGGVPGYSQLAVFSIISILLSLLGALFLLPHLLKNRPALHAGRPLHRFSFPGTFFILWLLMTAALLLPPPPLSFDSDLRALDGAEQAVWDAESRFRAIWGGGAENQGLAVVEAPEYETALDFNDNLYTSLQQQGDSEEFSSFSSVWKSRKHRRENLTRWQAFWTPKRIETLRKNFMEQGKTYGFKPEAFLPFFQGLESRPLLAEEPENNGMFDNFKSRFAQSLHGKYQFVSFFPDTAEWMKRVKSALGNSESLLVSRREINRVLSDETVRTVKRVALLAVVLVVLFTTLLMRRPREVVLALLPAVFGVLAALKMLAVFGLAVNIPTLIAGIVVIGLTIDYGIFMVFACKRNLMADVCTAVTLSTITTLIGAGVLLLTRHPALFSIGVTMVAGLTAGYATALCAIPFFARFLLKKGGTS